ESRPNVVAHQGTSLLHRLARGLVAPDMRSKVVATQHDAVLRELVLASHLANVADKIGGRLAFVAAELVHLVLCGPHQQNGPVALRLQHSRLSKIAVRPAEPIDT